MKKSHTSAIAFLAIAFLLFTACSRDSAGSDNQNEPRPPALIAEGGTDIPASHYDVLGERDFNGGTFAILDANDHPDFAINIPGEEMNGDPVNDALYMRDRFIEEKYGIAIKYIQPAAWAYEVCATLEKSILAGDDEYDMLVSTAIVNTLDKISTLATASARLHGTAFPICR